MKISKESDFVDFNKSDPTRWANEVDTDLKNIVLVLQGRVRFGANNTVTNKGENILGQFITYTTNATPNTEDTVAHALGSVPIGYIVVRQNKAASLYDSGTVWTSSSLFLKCSVASVLVTVFLIQ